MPPLDTGHWLEDVSAAEPAGPNLEFDADFGALERAALGKPEQQVGDRIIPAEDPDWREVAAQARALLDRSRDLRVIAHLGVARLHTEGIAGFAETMALMRSIVATRWDSVHPQLDPEDGNDPTLRANAINGIAEPGRVQRKLRDIRLAASKHLPGGLTWRDIAVQAGVAGVLPNPGAALLTEPQIRGTFREADQAAVGAVRAAVAGALADLREILGLLNRLAPKCKVTDLDDLEKLLRTILADIDRFAVVATVVNAPAEDTVPADAPDVTEAAPPRPAASGVSAASLSAISTRADALQLLDLVLQYYQRYEPSSPLPLLIDRARRLADKSFLEILRDLAPDGIGQAQTIAGPRDE